VVTDLFAQGAFNQLLPRKLNEDIVKPAFSDCN
jgi:hypothetical protein